MSRTSALGCVARTVLISGSSTGLVPPPRGAPSRASRRRTAAVPAAAALVSPGAALTGRTAPRTPRVGSAPLRARPAAGPRADLDLPGGAAAGRASAAAPSADAPSADAPPTGELSAGAPPAAASSAGGSLAGAALAVSPSGATPTDPVSSARAASPGAAGADATPSFAADSSGSVCSRCPVATWVTSVPADPAVATSPATCAPHVRRSTQSIDGRVMTCPFTPPGEAEPVARGERGRYGAALNAACEGRPKAGPSRRQGTRRRREAPQR